MRSPPEDGIHAIAPEDLEILQAIERRVLWLSTYMIHHANKIRPNPDGLKVGGHQASSSSVVSLATALYFHFLRPQDHVAFKPHASPVFHAIQYLLGRLPQNQLQRLREVGGLQAYPSRVKDPDQVTMTTGSVGLGSGATIFGALAQQYVEHHFQRSPQGRYIALVGDAEIDEGNVTEALGEARVYELDKLWWIIDFNRQSLDFIAPEGRAMETRKLFEAKGWHVILLKYGSRQEAFFKKPHGDTLRDWIDACPNVEYQSLCRADGAHIRDVIINWRGKPDTGLAELLTEMGNDQVKELALNLGGHDLPRILEAFNTAERVKGQPVAILAYTIKGWGLPIAGHFENHAAQLTHEQIESLRRSLNIPLGQEWEGFAPHSSEGQWIRRFLDGHRGPAPHAPSASQAVPSIQVPAQLGTAFRPMMSTQEALGRILVEFSRVPDVVERTLTISPDVAVSTNLGGWISKMGVYAPADRPNYFAIHNIQTLVRWRQSTKGNHRTGHCREQLLSGAGDVWAGSRVYRRGAISTGDDLRSLCGTRSGRVDLRGRLRRQIHFRRHPFRHYPEPRGGRASVNRHPISRHGTAEPALLRTGLRLGARVHSLLGLPTTPRPPAGEEPLRAAVHAADRAGTPGSHASATPSGARRGILGQRLPGRAGL
ncbi:MAG TPA: 1-deoxy-D-xylulose-5-phosphate synthase N-terminal domain-containing protein [Candidatus Tectomicrobia bacterium]